MNLIESVSVLLTGFIVAISLIMGDEEGFDFDNWKDIFTNEISYFISAGVILSSDDYLNGKGIKLIAQLRSCILVRTSGSSGIEKWVVHSKFNLLKHAKLVNSHLAVTSNDVFGLVLPAYHVGGIGLIARAYVSGADIISMGERWSAARCIEFIKVHQVTVLSLVPTQLVDLIKGGYTCPGSIRVIVIGGGVLDDTVFCDAIELGWPVKKSYGMTETGAQIATGLVKKSNENDGFVKLIDGWQIRVGKDSILEIKGDCLFKGYLTKDENKYFKLIDPKVDGWFRTSDRVEIREYDGEFGLKFLGRSDQRVKVLGELVNVSILEDKLRAFIEAEVYIITINDARRGVKLVPVVIDESLVKQINGLSWSGLRRLEGAVVIDDFPKNEMGKLMRIKLSEIVESVVFPSD